MNAQGEPTETWKVIHGHSAITFQNLSAALAYARGYMNESTVDLVEMLDKDNNELIILGPEQKKSKSYAQAA